MKHNVIFCVALLLQANLTAFLTCGRLRTLFLLTAGVAIPLCAAELAVPNFVAILAGVQAQRPTPRQASDAARSTGRPASPSGSTCETRTIAGWTVHVSCALLATNAAATRLALERLTSHLESISRVVPQAAAAELRKVPLWLSPEYPGIVPRAEYHPNAGWLRENGRNPSMAKGIEFTNVRIFESETKRMPVFVLHELAHAYHDRFLPMGFDNPEIKSAYAQAKASGQYEKVERRDAQGRVSTARAYALTNPQEYFAETTEAFFGTNDFFPFNREQLKRADPTGFALMERAWGKNRAEPAAAVSND